MTARVPSSPTLSVVIPTWNEAPLIADAVDCARRIGGEVVVADGESPDGTADLARAAGAMVVVSRKGRGRQVHAGAEAAKGDLLLFLHADARLPPAAAGLLLDALRDPDVIGGNFLVRFLPESWFTRILVPFNDVRRRWTRRYYGDSGIFIRRTVYFELGGMRPWPVMHDYEFSMRMEARGRCVYIRKVGVWASSRRFQGRELRTALAWAVIQLLFRLGISPFLLARAYSDIRGGERSFVEECRRRLEAHATRSTGPGPSA